MPQLLLLIVVLLGNHPDSQSQAVSLLLSSQRAGFCDPRVSRCTCCTTCTARPHLFSVGLVQFASQKDTKGLTIQQVDVVIGVADLLPAADIDARRGLFHHDCFHSCARERIEKIAFHRRLACQKSPTLSLVLQRLHELPRDGPRRREKSLR